MFRPSFEHPGDAEYTAWRQQREATAELVREQERAGRCYQCAEQQAPGTVFGRQHVLHADDRLFAVLASDPRSPGHTIVVWREHVQDFTGLDDHDTGHLFAVCARLARAIQAALAGTERVYLVSMCDGAINHLHVQLIPRYQHETIGSKRLVSPRQPLREADEIAPAIRQRLAGDDAAPADS